MWGLMAGGERQDRAVIVTALGLESAAMRAWLANPSWVTLPSGVRYLVGPLTDQGSAWQVALLEIGEGQPWRSRVHYPGYCRV